MFTFSADEKIQQVAEAYSLDAVDVAKSNFKLILDWSDSSVAKIESILDMLHAERTKARPSDDQVWAFAKMLGSYVGEVYRKNHGATWGMITSGGDEFPGLQAANKESTLFWPWGRVHNRLTDGPSDNVWHYYQNLIKKSG